MKLATADCLILIQQNNMKKTIFLLLFFLTSIFCFSQNNRVENTKTFNLKGKVKQIEQLSYKISQENKDSLLMKTVYQFDKKGNLLSKVITIKNSVNSYIINTYNNFKITESTVSFLGNDVVYYYQTDSKGKVLNKKFTDRNGEENLITFNYNQKNQLLSETKTKNNKEEILENYQYDIRGNLIEKNVFNNGDLLSKTIYHYNLENLLESEKVSNSKGQIISEKKYKYDDQANVIEEVDKNNIIQKKYSYDKKGNWIKCSITNNGVRVTNIYREIKYFKSEINQKYK